MAADNIRETTDYFIDIEEVRQTVAQQPTGDAYNLPHDHVSGGGVLGGSGLYLDDQALKLENAAGNKLYVCGNLNGFYGYVADTYGVAMGEYAANYAHVTIDSTNGIRIFKDTATVVGQWQVDGDLFLGSDISAPATTHFAIFVNAQTYNTESVGAGDLLLGDNSANKANMFWDKSAGKLQFRGGQTMQVEISTTGQLTAASGNVTLDSNGITCIFGATGRIRWYTTGEPSDYAAGIITCQTTASTQTWLLTLSGSETYNNANIGLKAVSFTDADTAMLSLWTVDASNVAYGAFYGTNFAGLKVGAGTAPAVMLDVVGAIKASAGATIDGALLWTTDNTYDIGASGATRPRHGYLSGALNLGTVTATTNAGELRTASQIRPDAATNVGLRANYLSVANLATAQLMQTTGGIAFIFIADTNANFAIFTCQGGVNATQEVSDPGGVYSATAGTATSTNIYWSAGNNRYEIQNNRGADKVYYIAYFGFG